MRKSEGNDTALETWGLGLSLGAQMNAMLRPHLADKMPAAGRTLPSRRFDSGSLSRQSAVAAWLDFLRARHPFEHTAEGRGDTPYWTQDWDAGGVILSRFGHPETLLFRRPRRVPPSEVAHVDIRLFSQGRMSGLIGDDPFRVTANEVHLLDAARPLRVATSSVVGFGLQVPYEALGYDPRRHPAHVHLALNTAGGIVVAEAMRALAERVPTLTRDNADTAVQGFLGLLRATLRFRPEDDAAEDAQRGAEADAIRRWADERLSDPAFGEEDLQRRFGADPTAITAAFEAHGGLRAYVSARRLENALRLIVSGKIEGGYIKHIARRIGLPDGALFTRAFEARFGMTPEEASDLARLARPDA